MNFYKLLLDNRIYIILSICIIASTIALIPGGTILYSLGIIYIFIYLFSNIKKKRNNNFVFYLFFILATFLSNVLNLVFDIRYFNFLFLLFVCCPLLPSSKNLIFKIKLLYVLFYVVIFFTIVNLYCYYAGINLAQILYKDQASINDFSGIMVHPMWLSAFAGLSTVVSFYFFLSSNKKNEKILYLVFMLISIFVTVLGASRIALISSFIVILLMLFLYERNKKNILKYIFLLVILGGISYPLYLKNASRMQMKIDAQKDRGVNSRQKIWDDRISEFEYSPIWGVGFATQLSDGESITGRMESGSGWLSVISQTGLLGFFSLLVIIKRAIKRWTYIKQNRNLFLFYGVFMYLCIHSIAEGYILTAGYYLCFLFWLVLDVLVQYDTYNKRLIK